ncbi:MAG TPA: carboxypeptidase-like regulatory domain-containing protein, partial [Planctomycetota bacterium]|nr:carboxypeptidase-like regulatory domain-containing protein [Planctomycetota bacterium]
MSARSWIAVVAGALLVLAAWFSLGIEGEPSKAPGPRSTAEAAGKASETASRKVGEAASATTSRQSALLREPELELRGNVVTTAGEPVAGATLSLILSFLRQVPGLAEYKEVVERTLATGRSDADGSFSFRLDPDRSHDLLAEAKGFGRIRMANLYAGEEVRVVLPSPATIFGRITDAVDGTPLAEVVVDVAPGSTEVSREARYRATTDRHGTYRLEALPPGVFELEVDARDHVRIWDRQVVLEEGQELPLDLPLDRGATVRGRVTDGGTKAPIEGASVVLRGESARRTAVTDAEGRYVLRGVPVTNRDRLFVSLRFRAPGYGEFEYGIPGVPEGEVEQDVFLLPGRRVRGRVVGRDGRPVPDAWVLASGSLAAHGTLQGDRRRARSDPDGRF